MTRYIANEDNLKTMMNLLRDKSKNIQFEAFHVFKVRGDGPRLSADSERQREYPSIHALTHKAQIFVANPKKPPQIESILRRNKDKLVSFLQNFQNDKDGMCLACWGCTVLAANSSWRLLTDEQFNVRCTIISCSTQPRGTNSHAFSFSLSNRMRRFSSSPRSKLWEHRGSPNIHRHCRPAVSHQQQHHLLAHIRTLIFYAL